MTRSLQKLEVPISRNLGTFVRDFGASHRREANESVKPHSQWRSPADLIGGAILWLLGEKHSFMLQCGF